MPNFSLTHVKTVIAKVPKGRRAAMVCAMVGHSRIVTTCFGYVYCARCEAQIGDSLGGATNLMDKVIVGHNCEECRKAYRNMTWRSKFMVANPFKATAKVKVKEVEGDES